MSDGGRQAGGAEAAGRDAAGLAAVRGAVQASVAAKQALLDDDELLHDLLRGVELVTAAVAGGGKVVFFGNGGSAADATHLAAEFVGRFRFDRAPLPALSLTDNGSSISAIGNDFGYEHVFARQLQAFAQSGDVAIGLSTSGTSPNVVAGLQTARELGLQAIAFTGSGGGRMRELADPCLRMPSGDTARIQECYMLLCHTLCELVEERVFRR